jgi:hypothetical protein
MLALLIKYKAVVIAAALIGALGLGGAGIAAASGALPLNAFNALGAFQTQRGASADFSASTAIARHIVHGTVIVQDNGAWVTETLDVGSVTSVSSSAITLKRADGSSATLTVTASTRWGAKGTAPKNLAKLSGREVAVLSQNGVAVHIGGRGVLEGFAYAHVTLYRNGKTREVELARGTVQSISATQISLTRADGVDYSATLTTKTRYHQASVKGPAQASAVKPGEMVLLLVFGGQVIAVRIGKS